MIATRSPVWEEGFLKLFCSQNKIWTKDLLIVFYREIFKMSYIDWIFSAGFLWDKGFPLDLYWQKAFFNGLNIINLQDERSFTGFIDKIPSRDLVQREDLREVFFWLETFCLGLLYAEDLQKVFYKWKTFLYR